MYDSELVLVESSPEERERLEEMKIDSSRFIKMHKMYQLACSLELPDDVSDSLKNKEKYPFTNVERLYNNPQIRKVLGISDDFEEISELQIFKELYKVILTDIAQGKEDSRSLGKDTDREKYAKKIGEKVATIKRTPKPISVSEVLKQTEKRRKEFYKKEEKPKPRSKRVSRGIIPSSFAFRLDQGASVRKLCDELKKMPIKSYPNISMVSFRVFLEKSLRLFLKMKGVKTIPGSTIQRKNSEVQLSDAPLGAILDYLIKRDVSLIKDNNVKKVLRNFKTSTGIASLSTLNGIIHNEEMCVTEEDVRKLWPSLERLFIIMLSQPGDDNGHVQDTTKVSRRQKLTS